MTPLPHKNSIRITEYHKDSFIPGEMYYIEIHDWTFYTDKNMGFKLKARILKGTPFMFLRVFTLTTKLNTKAEMIEVLYRDKILYHNLASVLENLSIEDNILYMIQS